MRTGGAWAIAPRRRRDVVGSKISSEVASRSKSREFHPPERWRSQRLSIRISVCKFQSSVCKFQSVERSMLDRDDRNRPLLCTLPNESICGANGVACCRTPTRPKTQGETHGLLLERHQDNG